jgi:Na+-transporting NADH:ubiquinone oxidoreductase subunit A
MSQDIQIKKGLDIKLKGAAEKVTEKAKSSNVYTLIPEDFHNIIPKLTVKVGAKLKAGETVFFSKANEAVKFPSPVSGELVDIIRGEKKKDISN